MKLLNFSRNKSGANAVEYSLILAVISLVIVAAAALVGQTLANVFFAAGVAAFGGS